MAGNLRSPMLAPRDQQIALLVAHGLTNAQIAKQLNLSVFTVRNQVIKLLRMLGLKNRSQVAREITLYVDQLIPLSDAKGLTGLTIREMRMAAREGQLHASRVGRIWFTTREAIDRFISNNHVNEKAK